MIILSTSTSSDPRDHNTSTFVVQTSEATLAIHDGGDGAPTLLGNGSTLDVPREPEQRG